MPTTQTAEIADYTQTAEIAHHTLLANMRNCNRLLVTFLYNIFLQDAVVINQPLAPPSKVDAGHTRAKEHFILTVVMMLLCFLHGNLLAFICLIPAFLFSRMVNDFAWLY